LKDRWEELYGPGVKRVSVASFAAEVRDGGPALDPSEHDDLAWCSYEEAHAFLDWPIELDAISARRAALTVPKRYLQSEE
jgi:hypothetical protein